MQKISKKSKLQRGSSLAEAIVSLAVAVIIITILSTLFVLGLQTYRRQQAVDDAFVSLRQSVNDYLDDINMADSMVASYTSAGTTYNSTATQAVLQSQAVNSSGNAIYDSQGLKVYDYIVYTMSGSPLSLKKRTFPATSQGSTLKVINKTIINELATGSRFNYAPVDPSSDLTASWATVNQITIHYVPVADKTIGVTSQPIDISATLRN